MCQDVVDELVDSLTVGGSVNTSNNTGECDSDGDGLGSFSDCDDTDDTIVTDCSVVCDGDFTIGTDAEFEAVKDCTMIDGSLQIGTDADVSSTTLTNLDDLSGLTAVSGNLKVDDTAITHVDGLANLRPWVVSFRCTRTRCWPTSMD